MFWFDSSITCCLIASKGLLSLAPCQALNSFEQEHGDLLSPDVIRPLFYEKISSNVYHISSKVSDNKKNSHKRCWPHALCRVELQPLGYGPSENLEWDE